MSNVYEASKPVSEVQQPAPAKSGCGCWIWGCLSVVLIGLIGLGLATWLGVRFLGGQIEKYTDETPQELPVVEYDEQELADLETKLEDFNKKLSSGEAVEDLVLTADDINAMIANKEKLRGRVFVKIEDGQIKGDISIPLDNLPLGVGKERFLNASAGFKVAIANEILIVTMEEAEVKGEPVPEEFMQQLRTENLAKDVKLEPETQKLLARIDKIEVEDGKIVLRVRPETAQKDATADEPAEGTTNTEGIDPAAETDPATNPESPETDATETDEAEVTEADFPDSATTGAPAETEDPAKSKEPASSGSGDTSADS